MSINPEEDAQKDQFTVPGIPNLPPRRPLITSITSRDVSITWTEPNLRLHETIMNYRIWIRSWSSKAFQNWYNCFSRDENGLESFIDTPSNKTKFLITGLQPFTTYWFKVSTKNSGGISIPSKESFPTQMHRESKKM